ncbi:MAG: type II secretion system protein [Gammaproteobacteria bacterium]|nr:type II secretion system protein [Gammaproteobacteria bacterium]
MNDRRRVRAGRPQGFTLIELIVVLIILGILAALTSDIILKPFRAFQDQARRAQLVAEADTAMTRMVRELRHALPNSVRVAGGGQYLEFIPTIDGGRYRAAQDPSTPAIEDILDFTQADVSFDVVGGLQSGETSPGDFVVVYNTGAGSSDAYKGDNRASISSVSPTSITLTAGKKFPHPSLEAQRFDIVPATGPVTFYCQGGALRRHTGYGFAQAQPTGFTSQGALLAEHVTTCQFDYNPGDNVRSGVVTMRLRLTDAEGESIALLYQAHVVNAP